MILNFFAIFSPRENGEKPKLGARECSQQDSNLIMTVHMFTFIGGRTITTTKLMQYGSKVLVSLGLGPLNEKRTLYRSVTRSTALHVSADRIQRRDPVHAVPLRAPKSDHRLAFECFKFELETSVPGPVHVSRLCVTVF